MRKLSLILLLLLPLGVLNAQTVTGSITAANGSTFDLHNAVFIPGVRTVSTLPSAASSTNAVIEVTDGTSASDCTVGSGSTRSLCASTGSAWVSVGGGGTTSACLQDLGTITTAPTIDGGSTCTVKFIHAILGATIGSCTGPQNFTAGEFTLISLNQDATGGRTLTCPGLTDNQFSTAWQTSKSLKQYFVATSPTALDSGGSPPWCPNCSPPGPSYPTVSGGGVINESGASGGNTTNVIWPNISGTFTPAQTIAAGSSALGTSAISSTACATVVSATATGTLTTDVVEASFNSDPLVNGT